MTRWMKANSKTAANYHSKRHREIDACELNPPCKPEEETVRVRMMGNPNLQLYNYHAKPHDRVPNCDTHDCTFSADPANADLVCVVVPKTGLHVIEHGEVLPTAQSYTLTRTVGPNWRLSAEVQRYAPFFEVGKKYKMDGQDKWFKCTHVDKHPTSGVDYAHGWMEQQYPDGGTSTFHGSLTKEHRDFWQEV